MNIETFRDYCLSLKGVTEETPFGPDTLVYKVMGKMFALTGLEGDFTFNVKCNPVKALELREQHPCVLPGYHMNKRHWNTVVVDGSVNNQLLKDWIDHSYNLVVSGLSRKLKEELQQM